VPGQIAGLDLSSVNETSPARLQDLTAVAQERVKQGIHAESRSEAAQTLSELTADNPSNPNLKPLCSAPSTTPTAPAGSAPAGSAPAVHTSSAAASLAAGTPSAQASESAPSADDADGCRTVN